MKGLSSGVHSSYQPAHEPIAEGFDNKSKSSEQQNVSNLLTLSSAVCRQSFVSELVQPTVLNILFDLAIPSLSVKLRKPSAESGKLGRLEPLNFLFYIFDLAH
jgi:hypothetical protein